MKINHRKGRSLKLVAAVAALAAGALSLTGCSSASNDSSDKTLTVWHYFSDENQVKILDDYATIFESENPGATVENVYVPYDQLNPRLISSASSGKGPDVVVFNGADTSTLALSGALAPMTDYWANYEDSSQFPESVVHSLDSDVYAVQGYVNLLGLWYNADILKEIGVQPPTTLEELNAAMAAAVKAGYQGITLSGLPNGQGEWQANPWLTSFGFNYDDPQAAPLTEAFTMIQDWTNAGYLTKEAVTWDQTVPFQTFAAGGVAFAENGNWQQGTAASTAKFEYGVVPLPIGSKGQVYLGGEGQAIGAFSKNPDLAWSYLKSTYFSYDGGVIAAEVVGSIPARTDAASDSVVTSNPLLGAFAQAIAENGANYPSPAIPAKSVADQQLLVGQVWSAIIGGQLTPEEGAKQIIDALANLL